MWRALAVSVIGTAHERSGLPCQDYGGVQALETVEGSILIAVASDGAGSAPRACTGAHRVCETVFSWAQRELAGASGTTGTFRDEPHVVAQALFAEVRDAIAEQAEVEGVPPSAFAATLLAAVVAERHALLMQLGDGAIVFRTLGDTVWHLALEPERGEYANETVFITSSNAATSLKSLCVDAPVTDLVMMTDGAAFLGIRQADNMPYAPFFTFLTSPFHQPTDAWREDAVRAGLERFLASPEVAARTDDDKTVVIACRCTPDAAADEKWRASCAR